MAFPHRSGNAADRQPGESSRHAGQKRKTAQAPSSPLSSHAAAMESIEVGDSTVDEDRRPGESRPRAPIVIDIQDTPPAASAAAPNKKRKRKRQSSKTDRGPEDSRDSPGVNTIAVTSDAGKKSKEKGKEQAERVEAQQAANQLLRRNDLLPADEPSLAEDSQAVEATLAAPDRPRSKSPRAGSSKEVLLQAEIDRMREQLTQQQGLVLAQNRALETYEEQCQCHICLDTLWRPFTLVPCGHTFCLACLVSWFEKPSSTDPPPPLYFPSEGEAMQNWNARQKLRRRKICPQCRVVLHVPPVELWPMKNLLDRVESDSRSIHQLIDNPNMEVLRAELGSTGFGVATVPAETTIEKDERMGLTQRLKDAAKMVGGKPQGHWFDLFRRANIDPDALHFDEADRVWRCPECGCEADGGDCIECGHVWDDWDDDMDEGESLGMDEEGHDIPVEVIQMFRGAGGPSYPYPRFAAAYHDTDSAGASDGDPNAVNSAESYDHGYGLDPFTLMRHDHGFGDHDEEEVDEDGNLIDFIDDSMDESLLDDEEIEMTFRGPWDQDHGTTGTTGTGNAAGSSANTARAPAPPVRRAPVISLSDDEDDDDEVRPAPPLRADLMLQPRRNHLVYSDDDDENVYLSDEDRGYPDNSTPPYDSEEEFY